MDIRKLLNEVRDNYGVPNPDGPGLIIVDEYEDGLVAMIKKLVTVEVTKELEEIKKFTTTDTNFPADTEAYKNGFDRGMRFISAAITERVEALNHRKEKDE